MKTRLKELQHEYTLAHEGLTKGFKGTTGAMISVSITLIVALIGFLITGSGFLSGNHIVIIFGILAATVIVYFSFVFGRAAKLHAEIQKQRNLSKPVLVIKVDGTY